MLLTLFLLFHLGSVIQSTKEPEKSRCAVVIFVNQSSFNSEKDFSEYVENIRGLSSNTTNVYFSEDPDLFEVRHGRFIDAPGLFALESYKFPGKFLRRANHTIVLEEQQSTEDFKNDATFLMDHAEKNQTYTTLKLFSHRSWKLSTPVDPRAAPLFSDANEDDRLPSRTSELLVIAQPCPENKIENQQVVKTSEPKLKSNVKPNESKSVMKTSEPKHKSNVKLNQSESIVETSKPQPIKLESNVRPSEPESMGKTSKPQSKLQLNVRPKEPESVVKTSELKPKSNFTPSESESVVKPSKLKLNVKPSALKSGSGKIRQHVTEKPTFPTDASLSGNTNTKYLTAITNQGSLKTIPNEYSFNNFEVPDFIMNSLVENAKNAGDGIEAPKPEVKTALVMEDKTTAEHANKSPTTKQKISELSSLIDDPDIDDLENNLKNLQYGSKGCKLLFAEDTMEEDAASKDSVAHPKLKKECVDEFPEACVGMAKKGYCLAFKSLMSSVCRKSCNVCARLLDTGFTSCTKTCGGGKQMRMIKINRREYLQTRRCNTQPCPINGGYSAFGHYTECSVTCGDGVKYRRRTCTNPRPQYNGKSCRTLGPSIESRQCNSGACPQKHSHKKKQMKKKMRESVSHHHKAALHIDGPHSDGVHQHSVLLKGKKVANLRCTPKKAPMGSIDQDSTAKRFTVYRVKTDHHSSKKSSIKENDIVYDRDGLPVDTARTVVKAFQSPYKIILARKGRENIKLLEECLEVDDKLGVNDGTGEKQEENLPYNKHDEKIFSGQLHEGNLVFTRPGEKSYSDFDEYKYEAGNVVTPEATKSQGAEETEDYSTPNGKLFGQPKNVNDILDKMNSIKPKINDQLSQDENLENSLKMANARPVEAMTFTGPGNNNERDMDSASHAGFTVTTTSDSMPQQGDSTNTDKDSYGYNVESMPDR